MLAAGVNVVRINFSHADASALQLIALVRKIADELNHPVAVMADLQGPKIRVGRFHNKSITLIDGQNFTLDCMARIPWATSMAFQSLILIWPMNSVLVIIF